MDLEARLRRAELHAWLFRTLFVVALVVLFTRPHGPLSAEDGSARAELTAERLTFWGPRGRKRLELSPEGLAFGDATRLGSDGLDLVGGGGTVKLGVRADGPHMTFLDRDNGQLHLAAAFVRFVCDGEVRLNAREGFPVGLSVEAEGRTEHFPRGAR